MDHKLFLDLEMDGVNPLVNKIYSVQMALDDEPVRFYDTITGINWGEILGYLGDPNLVHISHNAITEVSFIYQYHNIMMKNLEDTMVLPFVLDRGVPIPEEKTENKREYNRAKLQSVGLKRLANYYLGADTSEDSLMDTLGTKKYKGILRFIDYIYKDVPAEIAFAHKMKVLKKTVPTGENVKEYLYDILRSYAEKDILYMRDLYKMMEPWPRPEAYWIEMKTIPHLAKLQLRGIKIDQEKINTYEKELDEEIALTTKRMREISGNPDLIPSNKIDCAQALRGLGIEVPKTEKGRDGTGKKYLHAIKHEFIDLFNRYNTAASRKSNNIKGIYRHTIDGVFYPQYISCGTVHGRMASKNLDENEEQ